MLRILRIVCLLLATASVAAAAIKHARSWPTTPPTSRPAITLTYSAADNARFAVDIEHALKTTNRALAHRLCLPLMPGLRVAPPAACGASPPAAAIVHAVVLRDGVIWRFYSTHPWTFDRPIAMASLAKAVVAVPMLVSAGARADERWCQAEFPGVVNAGGGRGYTDCTAPGALISATQAIATSNNLALRWRLSQRPTDELSRSVNRLGPQPGLGDTDPATAIAFGLLALSPRIVLETFDALASGRATRAAFVVGATAPPSSLAAWAAAVSADPARHQLVLTLLSEPTRTGGTAAHLPALLPRDVVQLIAKTGTPANAGLDTGKVLVASLVHHRHRFTFFVSVSSSAADEGLSPHLDSADFAALHGVVAAHLN